MKKIERDKIEKILNAEKNIIFAYLYGSFLSSCKFKDIDLGIYLKEISFGFIADLKLKLAKILSISSDFIDIALLNNILDSPDAFSLLYLERLLKEGRLIVNHNFKIWSDFIERYSTKYRASEGILEEAR